MAALEGCGKYWGSIYQLQNSCCAGIRGAPARCVSCAAGVMIRLCGSMAAGVLGFCLGTPMGSAHEALHRKAATGQISPGSPEHASPEQAYQSNSGQSQLEWAGGRSEQARANQSKSEPVGAESYHRFGAYFGIFEHAGRNPEPRRQAATGFG